MTYRELAERILSWDDDKQEQTVTVFDSYAAEYYPLQAAAPIRECFDDVLDDGHMIIAI